MARELQNQTNVNPPDSDYPYGRIRNRNGATPGTPVSEELYGDMHQFFAKLMNEGGITPNDLPDNDYNGYQLWEAFRKLARPYKVTAMNVTQGGSNAPTATIYQDEIGNITFSRNSAGDYEIETTPTGTVFTGTKTIVLVSPPQGGKFVYARRTSDTNISLQTRDGGGILADNVLNTEIGIEIRVYD